MQLREQVSFDDTCIGTAAGANTKGTIARYQLTTPNDAPFVILEARNVPQSSTSDADAIVVFRWDTVLRPTNFATNLVERGNPFA